MDTNLNEKQLEENREEQMEEQQTAVWKLTPVDHKMTIICAFLSAALILLGILLVWGWIVASIAAVLTVPLGLYIYYKLQRWVKLEKAIIYLDHDEMYMIFLDKKDMQLRQYLNGELDVDRAGRTPGELLVDLAEWSVLCHITNICNIIEKKEKTFMLYVIYKMLPFDYEGNVGIPIRKNCVENFETLMTYACNECRKFRPSLEISFL